MIAIMLTQLSDLMADLPWTTKKIDMDQSVFRTGDKVSSLFWVRDGEVRLVRYQRSGHALTLQQARRGDVLADASVFTDRYHCDAIAHGPTVLSGVAVKHFRQFLKLNPAASELWMRHLGRTAQEARFRAEMISLKKVDDRIDAWIDWTRLDLPDRGKWKGLAEELAVTPEALYRALAKRR